MSVRLDRGSATDFVRCVLLLAVDVPDARSLLVGAASTIQHSADHLARLPVPVPPLDEQRRIAAYLDEQTAKIDALIAETERFIELLASGGRR